MIFLAYVISIFHENNTFVLIRSLHYHVLWATSTTVLVLSNSRISRIEFGILLFIFFLPAGDIHSAVLCIVYCQ